MNEPGSRRWMMPFFLAPVLGVLSLILPVLALSPARVKAPLFPLLATGVKHISLATHPDFEEIFVDAMNFPRPA